MRYRVKTFHSTIELEEYLNESKVDINDIKIAMNHKMILLIIRYKLEGGAK